MATMTLAEKRAVLKKVMDAQNTKAGEVVVGYGNEIAKPLVFLPMPSGEWNLITGGGIPRGRITEIFGNQSSGKTSAVLEAIGEDMARDPEAVWLWGETEEPFDLKYATEIHGIDPQRFILVEQSESGGEDMIDLMEPYLRSGAVKGFGMNSVAGLAPKKELNDSVGKDNIALQARMMSRLMRKWGAIINKRNLYAIFINQMRTNVGAMFGDPNVTTGGRALSFWASLRIGLNKLQFEESEAKVFPKEEFMKVGMRIAKNRCVYDNPYKKGSYVVEYGVGVDKFGHIIDQAPLVGALRKAGSNLYYEDADGEQIIAPEATINGKLENDVPLKWKGRGALRTFMKENVWFLEELTDKVNQAAVKGELVATYQDEEELKEIERLEQIEKEIEAEEAARAKKAKERKEAKEKGEPVKGKKPATKKPRKPKETKTDE